MNIVFNRYPEGKLKALTMSYDDGPFADRRLVGIFDKYGIRGSFHLNSNRFYKDPDFKPEEVAELYKNHEISCHTLTHPFPKSIPAASMNIEILKDKDNLEKIARYPVRGMSYPYGDYTDEVITQFRALGMEYSRTTRSTNGFAIPEDFMQWHPTCHHKGDIMNKLEIFKNPPRRVPCMMLFYVWGHSYEFDNDNNWELIEEFCAAASGLEDVWYATNIEIYDYVCALRALRFSADCSIVYNPSAIPVWFTADGNTVKVEAGETKKLGENV